MPGYIPNRGDVIIIGNHPFEVLIPPGLPVDGVILTQQVKSLDWQARNAVFKCKMPDLQLRQAAGKVTAILR